MYNSSKYSSEVDMEMWVNFVDSAMQLTYPKWMYATVMLVIFASSLCGNLLTCVVIYMDKSMRTPFNYYLFNLAASDLMVTFTIFIEICGNFWYDYSTWLCHVQWFCVVCLWNGSILTMTALSVERYLAIWHPLLVKSTSVGRRVGKVIGVIWLVAVAETAPEMLTVDVVRTNNTAVCFMVPTRLARIQSGVLGSLTFLLPLAIMTLVYSTIAFKVNIERKKKFRDTIFNHRDPRRRINILIIALTVSYFICWTPFFIIRMLMCLLDIENIISLTKWWSILFQLLIVTSWLSIVLNPILFSLTSTKFRKSLKGLWNSKIRRTSPTKSTR